jgi:hypothetical protein
MKYKKKAVRPTMFGKWLDLINSVPLKSGIYHSWETLWGIAYFELTGEYIAPLLPPPELDYGDWQPPTYEQQENLKKAFIKATRDLKENSKKFPKLYSYLFELENYPEIKNKFDEIRFDVRTSQYEKTAFQRYETFLDMRSGIRKIAQSCMLYHKEGRFIDSAAIFATFGFNSRNADYPSNFTIKEGKVDFESELIQVLRGIDAERLRICPICGEVFWAKRIETSTCSKKKCSNNFHQRKLRIAEYEKRFDKAFEAYKKLKANLSPENSLVEEQRRKVNELKEKIKREKIKNGTL